MLVSVTFNTRDDQNIDRIDREHRFSAAARVYSISLGNY
jgi:hypothetical protein